MIFVVMGSVRAVGRVYSCGRNREWTMYGMEGSEVMLELEMNSGQLTH